MRCRPVRSLVSGAFFVAYGLFALPFALLLLPPVWPERAVRSVIRLFYRSFVFLAGLTGLYRVDLGGGEIPAGGRGRIVVANHVSLIDICILMAVLPDSTAIAKAAVMRNPFLSMVVRRMFIVNDGDPVETIGRVRKLIDGGVNVIVFPQGTRGGTRLHRGAARLALECGAEIACFRLHYDPVVLAKGQPWWDVGDRTIRIGVENTGTIRPEGCPGHHDSVLLTRAIASRLDLLTYPC